MIKNWENLRFYLAVAKLGTVSDVISAIRVGMGVGFVSHHVARLYPDLVKLQETEGEECYPVWLLTHRDLRNTVRVKTFMQFMTDSLRKQLLPR